MENLVYYAYLLMAGILGGFVGGLLGIGGGMVFVVILPVALMALGAPPQELVQYTIANSLFATFFSTLVGNVAHYQRGQFYPRETLLMGAFSIVASWAVLVGVVNTAWYSAGLFNTVIIVVLAYMLLRILLRSRRGVSRRATNPAPRYQLALVGLSSGVISQLSGLGGGVIIVPLLNTFLKIPIKKASAISLGVISLTSLAATILNLWAVPRQDFDYFRVGYVIFPVGIGLVLGVLLGAPLGVRAARRVPSGVLNYIFAVLLAAIIIQKTVAFYTYLERP